MVDENKPTEFEDWRRRCRSEVEQDPKHRLSFASRRRLLAALGPTERRRGCFSFGHEVRTRLAVAVLEKVLFVWEDQFQQQHPHRIRGQIFDVLRHPRDEARYSALESDAYSFRGGLDNPVSPQQYRAQYVGHTAVCAAYVCVDDELLEPDDGVSPEELDDPEDPDLWDAAFWAAAAFAGDMPWMEDRFDAVQYLSFWTWYLADGLDSALAEAVAARG